MKKLILLADDNRELGNVLTLILDLLGYKVVAVRNGLDAVGAAISLHPDVIVMDLMMPKIDGFQATSLLRQHAETKSIPILATTAFVVPENREKCLASGCDDYIPKPFTPKELAAAIERLLQEARKSEAQTPATAQCQREPCQIAASAGGHSLEGSGQEARLIPEK